MSKKNWSKLFNKKNRTHKDSYNFNNKNLDDIVDFGTKAYKYDGKRWKESKEEDEQELEMSDSYTVNNPDSFASSKALFDLNAKVASDLSSHTHSKISFDANSYVEAQDTRTRIQTNSGYLDIGPMNTSWCHLDTDRASFYLNKKLEVNGSIGVYGKDASVIDTNGKIKASSIIGGSGSGLDADLLDGLQLHTGRNNVANRVVRTEANGYIDCGWINTTSGDSGISNDVNRIYCSNDGYLRYLGKSDFKVLMGQTKDTYDRRDNTTEARYWTGANSWGATGFNTLLGKGSGFIDTWSNPAQQPAGTSHWNGFQALHYTDGGNYHHGMQLVVGAGNPALTYVRGWWANGGSGYAWAKMWNSANDGSGSGLDADTVDGIQGSSLMLKSSGDDLIFTNYGKGVVGTYSSTRYQSVFSMGTSYRPSADGQSLSNMYGIAYTHTNVGGQSKAGLGHQTLFVESGTTRCAIGNGIWTGGNVTAASFIGDGSQLTGISSNLLISTTAPAGTHSNGAEWWNPDNRKFYKWIDQQPTEAGGVEEWRDVVSGGTSVLIDAGDPLYRVTFTQGYVFGGYRNSSPWRNVNRTIHATDVTTNLGDIMDEAGAYCTGGYSDTEAYMFGTDNAFPGTTNRVKKLNMFTETSAGASGLMSCARDDMGEFQDGDGIAGWVHGGGCANVDKIVWATDTFTNIRGEDSANHQNSQQYGSATGGYGYKSKGSRKMSFITESWSAMGNVVGGQTHSKTLPSKHERMYVENNGNSTEGHSGQVRNYNTTNDTHIGCNSFKPWRGGETNYEIGQDHGYGLGHCGDGCQSNHSFKSFYHTDSHLAGGTTMQPKGHDGMSSAGCGSRSS